MDQLEKIPGVDGLSHPVFSLPDWQITLGEEALRSIDNGTAELISWEETKKRIKL